MQIPKRPLVHLSETALAAAVLCAASPFTLPGPGAVPLSLATFFILLSAYLLGRRKAAAAAALYLAIGAAGLPVFAGGAGGFGVLAGPTGGYLAGYLFLAYFAGLSRSDRFFPRLGLTLLGTLLLYAFGTAWFVFQTGGEPGAALLVCVVPFLPGDAIKIAAALLFYRAFRQRKLL